jgi:hypothetical protein
VFIFIIGDSYFLPIFLSSRFGVVLRLEDVPVGGVPFDTGKVARIEELHKESIRRLEKVG